MPNVRFRKRLFDRLIQGANAAGEVGLALLMTVGVVHCGGSTTTVPSDGAAPEGGGYSDGHVTPEAAQEGGPAVEAAIEAAFGWDGSHPMVEAPVPVPDAGTDGTHPMVEAPTPAPSDASVDHIIWVEAAKAP